MVNTIVFSPKKAPIVTNVEKIKKGGNHITVNAKNI